MALQSNVMTPLFGLAVEGVPYISGAYYGLFPGSSTATIIAAADRIYFMPFKVPDVISFDRMAARVTTGQATSAVKGGIYGTKPAGTGIGRPYGAPIGADNTGVATTTSNANADLTLSGSLRPGPLYWAAFKFTTAGTLPTCTSCLTTSRDNEPYIGRDMPSNATGSGAATGIYYDQAYASNFPTFDGSESFTIVAAAALPLAWLRAV